jgi:hypothetical protein
MTSGADAGTTEMVEQKTAAETVRLLTTAEIVLLAEDRLARWESGDLRERWEKAIKDATLEDLLPVISRLAADEFTQNDADSHRKNSRVKSLREHVIAAVEYKNAVRVAKSVMNNANSVSKSVDGVSTSVQEFKQSSDDVAKKTLKATNRLIGLTWALIVLTVFLAVLTGYQIYHDTQKGSEGGSSPVSNGGKKPTVQ